MLQLAVSNQSLEHKNLELTFSLVPAAGSSENDRNTYRASMRELVDLDAVLVVSSGNIRVSPCFLQPTTVIHTIEMISPTTLVPSLQPTHHCLQVNSRLWLSAQLIDLALVGTTVRGYQHN